MASEGKTRVTVEIYGQTYVMVGPESREHMKEVARIVDQTMREIKEKSPTLDMTRIAVLTALNSVNDRLKVESEREKEK